MSRRTSFATPAKNGSPVKEDTRIVSEEKKQLNLILGELRKELTRMEADDWRFSKLE